MPIPEEYAPSFEDMGFPPGKVHVIWPDGEIDVTKLIALMRQEGQARIIRLATAAGTLEAQHQITVEVWLAGMTAVLRSGAEFEINDVYKVTETQWREIVGIRFAGEILGYRAGISPDVMALDAPRDVAGCFIIKPDEIAETPDDEHVPLAAKVWLQLQPPHATTNGGTHQTTPLLLELQ